MAETIKRDEELVLDDSIKVNKRGEAILGVLEGPCADVINPTRNERQYDEELWVNVFNDPIINEYFACGGILGELDHPAERTETDTSKVAICMPEKPKKDKSGKLIARFDILDTPNGRIVYTLAKYGYKLGVSSRGNGDVYEAFDGKEHVDPKTYELKAFDVVLLPAVKAARLSLKESVGNKTFKQAIKESLDAATKDEKRIMVESLKKLKIDYKLEKVNNKKLTESKVQDTELAAEDNGVYLVQELQRQIKKNKELTEALQTAQEKLSVCYAKEAKYEEQVEKIKANQSTLNESKVNDLELEIQALTERLNSKDKQLRQARERFIKLSESKQEAANNSKVLNESIITEKDTKILKLNEALKAERIQSEQMQKSLNESIEELKKNSAIKAKEYSNKLSKANSIVEHYKKIANVAVNKYIESKAQSLGVDPSDIKRRLSENYNFKDIDKVCEDLQGYQVTLSKLPINLQQNKKMNVKVTESIEPIKPKGRFDDDVDESLLRLAGLNNI